MSQFYILSLKNSMPSDNVLTWWRPDGKGYVWCLDFAGLFTKEEADQNCDGVGNIAIPKAVADAAASRYVNINDGGLGKMGVTAEQWQKARKQ